MQVKINLAASFRALYVAEFGGVSAVKPNDCAISFLLIVGRLSFDSHSPSPFLWGSAYVLSLIYGAVINYQLAFFTPGISPL